MRNNLIVFSDVIDFVSRNKHCLIFASIDNNQFIAFTKLLMAGEHTSHVKVIKESDLKKGSVEYRLSLIIDTKLNIERVSKQTRQA